VILTIAAMACGGNPSTEPDLADAMSLPGGSTLVFQDGSAFGEHRAGVERLMRETFDAARARIPLNGVTIIARHSLEYVIPEIGFGGRASAGTVWIDFDTDGRTWVEAVDTWLGPVLAHELHHVARFRAVGLYGNLLEAMVGEGAADRFLVELTGSPPPMWATALSGAQLAELSSIAEQQWFESGYDHAAWFFGAGAAIPRWAGYTIGFEIVGAHLEATSRSAADLYAEPARNFVEP
jgi:hypothetical protein